MLYESEYYGVCDLGTATLQHHGIKGQKWGRRRFQYENGILTPEGRARYDVGPMEKASARKIKKALNKADNMLSDTRYVKKRVERKMSKLQEKADKAKAKGKERKLERINKKLDAQNEKRKAASKTEAEMKKIIKDTIDKSVKAGYNIKSKEVLKSANEGKHAAAQYLFGLPGGLASRALDAKNLVSGKSYKVSKAYNNKGSYEHKKRRPRLI